MVIIKYWLFHAYEVALTLNNFTLFLLIFSTICVAAGGNVINDIYDVEIDKINKPKKVLVGKSISEKAGFNYYIILTVLD